MNMRISDSRPRKKRKMRLIPFSELSGIIGVSRRTLDRWYRRGAFPMPVVVVPRGRAVTERALERWLEHARGGSAGESGG